VETQSPAWLAAPSASPPRAEKLKDLTVPNKTVALHPAAQEHYLNVVNNLASATRDLSPVDEIVDAIRELIESVIVEKTLPGEPIKLKVNGRLAALIGQPAFTGRFTVGEKDGSGRPCWS